MNYADLKWSYMIKDINALQKEYEGQEFRAQAGIDATAVELFQTNPELGRQFLAKYCDTNAVEVRDAWWSLLDFLIWKYDSGRIIENGRIRSLGYPEEWLRRVIQLDEPDHAVK